MAHNEMEMMRDLDGGFPPEGRRERVVLSRGNTLFIIRQSILASDSAFVFTPG